MLVILPLANLYVADDDPDGVLRWPKDRPDDLLEGP